MRKKINQFILNKILLPLYRVALKLEFRKYKKVKKLSNLTYLYLAYRLRNIFNFHDIGWSKNDDNLIFFVISNLLELKHHSEDNDNLKEVEDEISALISKASDDYDVKVLVDIFAQLENVLNDKFKRDEILKQREIPHDSHVVELNDLKKTEKKLKEFSKKNIEVVKERTAFKINFTYSEVSSIIAVTAPLIIISSYLYNKTFYGEFGVDVSRYFSISDYISTSIVHIEKSLRIGIFAIIGMVLSLDMYSRNLAYMISNKDNRKRNGYLFFTLAAFLTAFSYYSGSYMFYLFLELLMFIMVTSLSDYIANRFFDNSIKAVFFFIFSHLIILISLIEGIADARHLKDNWKTNDYELIMKEKVEKSISIPAIFIGQNSKYIFLSDTSFSKISITENSQVELYVKTITKKNSDQ